MLPIQHPGPARHTVASDHTRRAVRCPAGIPRLRGQARRGRGIEEDVMALTFPSWTNMSDAFAGVPGEPIAVLRWGDHFAVSVRSKSRAT